ncbi:hypothetical protein N0V95_001448 [Ascochyta clinopodiicola]|nr:hypothetical protein N0V95_001448 [Ascochyta clinopodiicola]
MGVSFKVLFLLVSLLFALRALALSTTVLNGQIIRVPAIKPPPPSGTSSFDTEEIDIALQEHQSEKKLPRWGENPGELQDTPEGSNGTMCGLDRPTTENWDANREEIAKWARREYNDFSNSGSDNFALFLRNRWAPNALTSGLFCDALGRCSIGSCTNLVPDDGSNQLDRQMALYVFEQISMADHLLQMVHKQFTDVMNNILHRSDQIVEEFSSAPRIEQAMKDELKREHLGMAVGTSLGLVVAGGFGFMAGPGGAAVGLVVNTYVALVGALNEFRANPDFVDDLKESFKGDLGDILFKAQRSIDLELKHLMIGANNTQNRSLIDLLADSDFLEPYPELAEDLNNHFGRVVTGTAQNKMWEFHRAYILLVNNPGGCENDKTQYVRGPTEYLVCLPEHPELGFWLYSIDRSEEDDSFKDDQALVRGPTGFWRLEGGSEYFGLTLQDVVRSSYHVHLEDLVKKKGESIEMDPLSIDTSIRSPNETLGRVPRIFTIPICRNPGGEAISGVLSKKGRNYPCMCGETGWDDGRWTEEIDETPTFLLRSGFAFSEDWEDYCSDHNYCKGENSIDLKAWLNARRSPDDPEIPRKLRHNFKECHKRRDSRKYPGSPSKDMDQEQKRSQVEWAKYDETWRNTSRAVVSFEG